MIELYTAQYSNADGSVSYETPAFRKAVADVDTLAAALASDPKILYRKDGSNTIYGMVYGSGSSLISNGYTPLYLGIGDNTTLPAKLMTVIVNARSDQQAEALDFVRCIIPHFQTESDVALLAHPDYETLARQSYDELIASQIDQGEDQSLIDSLIEERDTGGYPSFYSRETIERYGRDAAPRLTFPVIPRFYAYDIASAYANGNLDTEGLIAALTEAAQSALN